MIPEAEMKKAAATPRPGASTRPTPTFISDGGVKPKDECDAKIADDTIPWAELSQLFPDTDSVLEQSEIDGRREVRDSSSSHAAVVECREGIRSISLSHHHHHFSHCSPIPAPTCQPSPTPCSPCCRPRSCLQSPGCSAKRCGVAQEPAMCGGGVVMFEQIHQFVDDICRPSKTRTPGPSKN